MLSRPVAHAGIPLLVLTAGLAGMAAGWLGCVFMELALGASPSGVALWRDPVAVGYAVLAGLALGVLIGPAVAWGWLRHLPLGAAVAGVAAAALAGALAGMAVEFLGSWILGTLVAVAGAVVALRRRYPVH